MRKVAVIGSGISGLMASYLLSQKYDVTLYEANNYLGGHTHTHTFQIDGSAVNVDSGFIVFNKKTYPNFVRLLDKLKVEYQKTDMSFTLYDIDANFYYAGTSLRTWFSQIKNIFNWKHWRLLFQVLAFNRRCLTLLHSNAVPDKTLSEYLQDDSWSKDLGKYYLYPMASAVWSGSLESVKNMPLRFFIDFFANHGFFDLKNRPQWFTVKNGSKQYIDKIIPSIGRVKLSTPVLSAVRLNDQWHIESEGVFEKDSYNVVVFACHADHARKILGGYDAFDSVLGEFVFAKNTVVVHNDNQFLPPNMAAHSSWNYTYSDSSHDQPTLTYYMNRLQSLSCQENFYVTVNPQSDICSERVYQSIQYDHPQYTTASVKAQKTLQSCNGTDSVYFCGAYLGNGFHEDGVVSAIKVAEQLGVGW